MQTTTTNDDTTKTAVLSVTRGGAPFFSFSVAYKSPSKELRRLFAEWEDYKARQGRLVTLFIRHRRLFASLQSGHGEKVLYRTAEVRAGGMILRQDKTKAWEVEGAPRSPEGLFVSAMIAGAWELQRRNAGRISAPVEEKEKRRGIICGLTPASRRRFRGELMRIDWGKQARIGKQVGKACFVTLTYPGSPPLVTVEHDGESWQWVDVEKVKRDLDAFGKRLMRYRKPKNGKAGAVLGAAWKMEIEERKSGAAAGEYAAHFHITVFFAYPVWLGGNIRKKAGALVYPEKPGFRVWVADAWSEIVTGGADDDHRQAGTQCKAVYMRDENPLKLAAYLCKYMSKDFAIERVLSTGEIVKNHTGKCWGMIGKPPFLDSMKIDIEAKNQWYTIFLRLRVLRESSPYLRNLSPHCNGAQIWGAGLDLARQLLDDLPPPADCSEWKNPLFDQEQER